MTATELAKVKSWIDGLSASVAALSARISKLETDVTTLVQCLPKVPASPAAQIVITTQPVGATSGGPLATQPNLAVWDAFGVPAISTAVTVTASLTGGGTLGGTTAVAASAGVATFTNLTVTGAGAHTLTFTASPTLPPTTSNVFTMSTPVPTSLTVHTQPVGAASGSVLATQPVVYVLDNIGNLATGATGTITAAIHSGTSVLSGTATVSISAGIATFTNLVCTGADTVTLRFTSSAGYTLVDSASFTITSTYLFRSGWLTALGSTDNAIGDGGAFDQFSGSGRANVLSVLVNGSVGWSGYGNVFAIKSSAAGPSGLVWRTATVPANTTCWIGFYFRNDDTAGSSHQLGLGIEPQPFIQTDPFFVTPLGSDATWKDGVKTLYSDTSGTIQTYPYPPGGAASPWRLNVYLSAGVWYRRSTKIDYLGAQQYKVYPEIYDLAGNLLHTATDYFTDGPLSLQAWQDAGNSTFTTDATSARNLGLGQSDSGSGHSGLFSYVADLRVSTSGPTGI